MAIRKEQTLELAAPYVAAFDATCRALTGLGVTIKTADPTTGVIDGVWPMGLASWGEKIHVEVGQADPTRAVVSFSSALRFGIVDWGKNQKNVTKIAEAIPEALAAGHS